MIKLSLNENFICRIWEDKSLYSSLKTISGETIEVIDHGKKNFDSGPDYKDAKIKIGGSVYTGSVEIHRTTNDWYLHNHQGDNKYNDLILHVVFYDDENAGGDEKVIKVRKARKLPAVILSEFLTGSIHDIWKHIINTPSPKFRIPCYPSNQKVSDVIVRQWLSELAIERLRYKTERVKSRLSEKSSELHRKVFWEQTLFDFICEALGYSKNKEQFLELSRSVDLSKIREMSLSRTGIEAVMFGTSGFLHDLRFRDEYILSVKSHWSTLKDKLRNPNMIRAQWNFFRLRPANFPTVRIAYASSLLHEIIYNDLFKKIINIFEESNNVLKSLHILFTGFEISEYWKDHYDFGKQYKPVSHLIGKDRVKDITVNVLLPLVNFYAVCFDKENLKSRVMNFYKKEKQNNGGNEVVRMMEQQLERKVNGISDEQALIQLHNFYCMEGRCKECAIGKIVFRDDVVNEPMKIILY